MSLKLVHGTIYQRLRLHETLKNHVSVMSMDEGKTFHDYVVINPSFTVKEHIQAMIDHGANVEHNKITFWSVSKEFVVTRDALGIEILPGENPEYFEDTSDSQFHVNRLIALIESMLITKYQIADRVSRGETISYMHNGVSLLTRPLLVDGYVVAKTVADDFFLGLGIVCGTERRSKNGSPREITNVSKIHLNESPSVEGMAEQITQVLKTWEKPLPGPDLTKENLKEYAKGLESFLEDLIKDDKQWTDAVVELAASSPIPTPRIVMVRDIRKILKNSPLRQSV